VARPGLGGPGATLPLPPRVVARPPSPGARPRRAQLVPRPDLVPRPGELPCPDPGVPPRPCGAAPPARPCRGGAVWPPARALAPGLPRRGLAWALARGPSLRSPRRRGVARPLPARGTRHARARLGVPGPCPCLAWPLRSAAPARRGFGSRGRGAPV
jgi:hypothetical protein